MDKIVQFIFQYYTPKLMNKEPKVGDLVWLDGYTTIAQQIFGQYPIEKIEERFDNFTGEKFLILLVNGDWYDERDGACYSNINSMYFLDDYE